MTHNLWQQAGATHQFQFKFIFIWEACISPKHIRRYKWMCLTCCEIYATFLIVNLINTIMTAISEYLLIYPHDLWMELLVAEWKFSINHFWIAIFKSTSIFVEFQTYDNINLQADRTLQNIINVFHLKLYAILLTWVAW